MNKSYFKKMYLGEFNFESEESKFANPKLMRYQKEAICSVMGDLQKQDGFNLDGEVFISRMIYPTQVRESSTGDLSLLPSRTGSERVSKNEIKARKIANRAICPKVSIGKKDSIISEPIYKHVNIDFPSISESWTNSRKTYKDGNGIIRDEITGLPADSDGCVEFKSIKDTFSPGGL